MPNQSQNQPMQQGGSPDVQKAASELLRYLEDSPSNVREEFVTWVNSLGDGNNTYTIECKIKGKAITSFRSTTLIGTH